MLVQDLMAYQRDVLTYLHMTGGDEATLGIFHSRHVKVLETAAEEHGIKSLVDLNDSIPLGPQAMEAYLDLEDWLFWVKKQRMI